ncbi:MAG: hypothetical protein ACI915_000255 [Gammaproteobacteria bacterium]|jgi:hypothetical protein
MPASRGFAEQLGGRFGQLRFKSLFLILLAILVIDIVIPDFIALIDEILLGILMMVFWLWRKPAAQKAIVKTQ